MKLRATVTVSAPVGTAFLQIADPEQLMTWVPKITGFRFTSEIVNGDLTGAHFAYTQLAGGGNESTVRGTVDEYDPPRVYTATFDSGALRYSERFTFEEGFHGTSIQSEVRLRPRNPVHWMMSLLLFPLLPLVQRQNLGRIKAAAEAAAAAEA